MSETKQHAKYSASSAHRWLRCPGAITMESAEPDRSSHFAEEGTVAHEVASQHLQLGIPLKSFVGLLAAVEKGKFKIFLEQYPYDPVDYNIYEVTEDMAGHVETYINHVKEFAAIPGALLKIEQRVSYAQIIGIENQYGTADAIVLTPDEITVIDLKYGMGVQVDAGYNEQLMLYAIGAKLSHQWTHKPKRFRLVIVQPRLNHVSEWVCTAEELDEYARQVRAAARKSEKCPDRNYLMARDFKDWLNPGEKQCRFCKAKGVCPALARQVLDNIADDHVEFDDLTKAESKLENANNELSSIDIGRLSRMAKLTDLAEIWIKGVREAVYIHLMQGENVPGFKLVRGREGIRKWADEAAAEIKMIPFLAEDTFKKSLISPTEAEKKLKKKAPGIWEVLQDNITRAPGKLSVAPTSDKRPAQTPDSAIEFEDLTTEE